MNIFAMWIYLIGIIGIVINRKNVIMILMSLEVMLVGINLNFIMCSVELDDIVGEIMSIFILTVAAGESVIGLGILITYYRVRGWIRMEGMNLMQG